MPISSEPLRDFQVLLSEQKPARIPVEVGLDVISTLCHVEDLSKSRLATRAHLHPDTASRYRRGVRTPTFDKFIRILDKLGYDLYLVKKQ